MQNDITLEMIREVVAQPFLFNSLRPSDAYALVI